MRMILAKSERKTTQFVHRKLSSPTLFIGNLSWHMPGFVPAEVPSAWLRTGSFLSGKGPKTINAQTGFIGWDRR